MSNERIPELQSALQRTATLFQTGGSRPSPSVEQGWIGQVNLALPDEELPVDADGEAMAPILQLYLPALPYVPDELKETELLTVFLSPNVLDHEDMSGYMCIREYGDTGKLVLKDFVTQPGIDFGDGYAFVLQIASDAKARLNIVDDGNLYFAKHKKDGTWYGYFDFY